jgi:hypothetical protein
MAFGGEINSVVKTGYFSDITISPTQRNREYFALDQGIIELEQVIASGFTPAG